jgi:cell division protease FtsH
MFVILSFVSFIVYSSAFIRPISWNHKKSSTHQTILRAKYFPLSKQYFENYIMRLNNRNISFHDDKKIYNIKQKKIQIIYYPDNFKKPKKQIRGKSQFKFPSNSGGIFTELTNNNEGFNEYDVEKNMEEDEDEEDKDEECRVYSDDDNLIPSPNYRYDDDNEQYSSSRRSNYRNDDGDDYSSYVNKKKRKSENFEVITDFYIKFKDIGGYDNVKMELAQCVDIMKNYTKYAKFNVRIPKGIIFEGPPGNGKTMFAKALAGEAGIGFISVSGSQFQEKYVGVGSSRIRELFALAKANSPCIIFIDEIDALARKRTGEDTSGNERDSTLNELLISMDGFFNSTGIFVVGATNRADLLDHALVRPGRTDKRIFVGNPDKKTRYEIMKIHLRGKPHDSSVSLDELVDLTNGFSGAEMENLVNEAMLFALRNNREIMSQSDIEMILNKVSVGWMPGEHVFTQDIINSIAVHEMGHVIVGMRSKHHSNISRVIINLSSPNSPGYTVFERNEGQIYTRDSIFEHIMILLGGRAAEKAIYGVSVTTGAVSDFEEVLKLAEKMVVNYCMNGDIVYPQNSEKYKELLDDETVKIIKEANLLVESIVVDSKMFIIESAEILKRDKIIRSEQLYKILDEITTRRKKISYEF